MNKTKIPYFGRLGPSVGGKPPDADPAEVREQIHKARAILDRMEHLLDHPLTHEEARAELIAFHREGDALTVMPMLRPVFLSHLVGRLRDDGMQFTAIAQQLKMSKQIVYRWYYDGAGGRRTDVPRTRKKRAVTKEED